MTATIGSLFQEGGKIWANRYDSETLENHCPRRGSKVTR
jgi:hypothetical protein